jgi:hypothetical protein
MKIAPEIEASRAVETIQAGKNLRRGGSKFNSAINNLTTTAD